MSRCVITGGAPINNYEAVRQYLKPDDFNIFCDCGLKHAEKLGVRADLIVGDFDSWTPDEGLEIGIGLLNRELNFRNVNEEIINGSQLLERNEINTDFHDYSSLSSRPQVLVIPHEKFDTDTVYGVREGLDRGYDEFLILGAIGRRFCHSLGNLYILVMLDSLGKKGMIVDDFSDMEIISERPGLIPDTYAGFSLLNITGISRGIKIEGARYDYLPDGEITCDYQYALSNEVLPGKTARVTVEEGKVLLIRDRK